MMTATTSMCGPAPVEVEEGCVLLSIVSDHNVLIVFTFPPDRIFWCRTRRRSGQLVPPDRRRREQRRRPRPHPPSGEPCCSTATMTTKAVLFFRRLLHKGLAIGLVVTRNCMFLVRVCTTDLSRGSLPYRKRGPIKQASNNERGQENSTQGAAALGADSTPIQPRALQ